MSDEEIRLLRSIIDRLEVRTLQPDMSGHHMAITSIRTLTPKQWRAVYRALGRVAEEGAEKEDSDE